MSDTNMRWKCFITTVWKRGERRTWEDIWLLPDIENYSGESVWLTVESLTSVTDFWSKDNDLPEIKVGNFFVDGEDIIVGVKDFDRKDILKWSRVWLTESGYTVTELIERSRTEFDNTNPEARAVTQAIIELEQQN